MHYRGSRKILIKLAQTNLIYMLFTFQTICPEFKFISGKTIFELTCFLSAKNYTIWFPL